MTLPKICFLYLKSLKMSRITPYPKLHIPLPAPSSSSSEFGSNPSSRHSRNTSTKHFASSMHRVSFEMFCSGGHTMDNDNVTSLILDLAPSDNDDGTGIATFGGIARISRSLGLPFAPANPVVVHAWLQW
mmetsp:Transcript_16446/g.33784  ORF Transcript_16446/g.33784 Transcript_16446/m.33784 type:complete len:130 (-) Transcript_16446:589-978(-)